MYQQQKLIKGYYVKLMHVFDLSTGSKSILRTTTYLTMPTEMQWC